MARRAAAQETDLPPAETERPAAESTARTAEQPSNVVTLAQPVVSKERAAEIMGELRSLKQAQDDANMANAGYYKDLKEVEGMNTRAIKIVRSIDRLAPEQRADLLKNFDAWRKALAWDQPDLFKD